LPIQRKKYRPKETVSEKDLIKKKKKDFKATVLKILKELKKDVKSRKMM
jgi:hypothetical protein